MNARLLTRLLVSFAIVASLSTLTWRVVREEPPKVVEPPAKPKTTAEVLVGCWEYPMGSGSERIDGHTRVIEFQADGKVQQRYLVDPNVPNPNIMKLPPVTVTWTGTYTLKGQTLTLIGDEDGKDLPSYAAHTIESITDETLVVPVKDEEGQPKQLVLKRYHPK